MNKLRHYRIWKGLLQKEAAIIAKISTQQYQNIENNRSFPRKNSIELLAKFYQVSAEQLYKGQFKYIKMKNK